MPDIEDVHAGLEAWLRNDPAVASAAPGGVWFDFLPQNVTQVAVVYRVQAGFREPTHDRRGYEAVLYSITAVRRGELATGVVAAAKAVRASLEGENFPAGSYTVIRCELDLDSGPIAFVEPDGDQRIHHRGRVWEVFVAPRV